MKKKRRSDTFRRLFFYLKPYWLMFAAIFLLMLGSDLLALAGPVFMGRAIDAMAGTERVDFSKVWLYGSLMMGFYLLSCLLSYVLSRLTISVSRKAACRMEEDVFEKLLRLPVGYFDQRNVGDLLSILSYDCSVIYELLSSDLISLLSGLLTAAVSFGMMALISVRMVCFLAVAVPLIFGVTRFLAVRSRGMYRERSACMGSLNSLAEETASGIRTVQAYGCEESLLKSFREKSEKLAGQYYKTACCSLLSGPAVNFINNSSLAVVSTLGAVFYMQGAMSLGKISEFLLYSRKFSGPVNETVNSISELQTAFACADRIFSILDEEEEKEIGSEKKNPDVLKGRMSEHGMVRMEHVSFGYGQEEVLHDFSMEVLPGSRTAIVGPTGAGKTTLINLLLRFYEYEKGMIFLNGREIRSLSCSEVRKSCAMVLQDVWMFHGTIYENLIYGNPDVSEDEVKKAAELAQIHEYLCQLPRGYQTTLSELGTSISKGQLQMLAIARAMLSRAPVLILDEATSNVDTRTERSIQKAMENLMRGRTSIVIAHRLSTVEKADRIIVMDHGRNVEEGTHEELLQKNGLYQKMVCAGCAMDDRFEKNVGTNRSLNVHRMK